MKPENLLNAINELIIELKNSSKGALADFFIFKYEDLKKSNNTLGTVKELSMCRAMAQYANFSHAEESKLDTVVECAIYILKRYNLNVQKTE